MPVVITDLESGHDITEIIGGVELTRVVRVTELTAAPSGQLLEALRDPGVPGLFEAWPGEPWFVIRREAFPDGKNAARIVLTYGTNTRSTFNQPEPLGDGQDVKTFSASSYEEVVTVDASNNDLSIPPPPSLASLPNYITEARILRAAGDLVFERREDAPPSARVRSYVDTVNANAEGTYAAGTLHFARLDAPTFDGGRTWQCTYRFRYRAQGWKHTDRYHAPDNRIPDDAPLVEFDIYQPSTWTGLNLDFSDNQTPIG